MEEDIEASSGASMVPVALALLGIILGGAGLYFGLTANQQIAPLNQSIDEGSSASARIDKQLSALDTRLTELAAQTDELRQTVDRLRLYGSQSEQLVKKVASGVKSNRSEIVTLAEKMKELADSGGRRSADPRSGEGSTVTTSGDSSGESNSASQTDGSSSTAPGSATTYTIQSGDNFVKIANRQNISLNALLKANPDADPRRLSIGQTIQIPAN